uniref:CARD domain-containing protein n=1 Tax=Fundulus heteroclitus TaxID=8078 RepID=A0A3Q2U524_FUNHE
MEVRTAHVQQGVKTRKWLLAVSISQQNDEERSKILRRVRGHSSPSLSWSLISQDPPADVSNGPRAASLPNMKLQSSFEEFTPDFTGDEDDETYWLRCSSPGLYQCRVSGLVFAMKAEGDVSYRIVPWSSRLLSQQGKKPAGPLFDIRCQQQSVAQLHLPHCEIPSTDKCTYLSVAHVGDEGIEFIKAEEITETHVIINITGFSAFGVVRNENSSPDSVQALVLLFYKPPATPESDHQINVLLLPKNVGLRNVLRFRKKIDRDERFLETPPHCRLQPKRLYTLSTRPGRKSVRVQPKEAEFDAESYDNYLPTFQVVYENFMSYIKLSLRERGTNSIWKRRVCFSTAGVRRSYGPTRQNVGPSEHLKEIRTDFIEGISEPVVQSLLDKLLKTNVLSDGEREAVEGERTRRDKARLLVDMVRRKGDYASSEMIRSLCELDPFLSKHLGLI